MNPVTDQSRIMNVLKLTSGALTLCLWFSSFFVWKYFDAHESKFSDPNRGRIYPLNTHGSVVYLTSVEHYVLYGLISASVVLFLLTIVLYIIGTKRS